MESDAKVIMREREREVFQLKRMGVIGNEDSIAVMQCVAVVVNECDDGGVGRRCSVMFAG